MKVKVRYYKNEDVNSNGKVPGKGLTVTGK